MIKFNEYFQNRIDETKIDLSQFKGFFAVMVKDKRGDYSAVDVVADREMADQIAKTNNGKVMEIKDVDDAMAFVKDWAIRNEKKLTSINPVDDGEGRLEAGRELALAQRQGYRPDDTELDDLAAARNKYAGDEDNPINMLSPEDQGIHNASYKNPRKEKQNPWEIDSTPKHYWTKKGTSSLGN